MTTWVALLRGINVGGKHKMPMADLRALCASLGYADVQTYIQSGNLVFRTDDAVGPSKTVEDNLVATLHDAITDRFGFEVPVVVRSADEFGNVAADHPLAEDGDEPKLLHVIFLGATPEADSIAALDADRSPPDTFSVVGREIFVRYPNGSARSKVEAAWFERELGVLATARNWNSVQKVRSLALER